VGGGRAAAALVAGFIALAVIAAPSQASAQSKESDPVGRFTGIVGTALLGFELVFDIELAVGLRHGVIIGISSVVGMAGGVIGGYYIERELTRVRVARNPLGGGPGPVAVVLLCAGMAGVVPTIIAFKNTSFAAKTKKGTKVGDESKKDGASGEGDGAAPPPEPAPAPAPAPGTGGVVSIVPGAIYIGAPGVTTGSSMGALEAEALGAAGAARMGRLDETRVTLFRYDF